MKITSRNALLAIIFISTVVAVGIIVSANKTNPTSSPQPPPNTAKSSQAPTEYSPQERSEANVTISVTPTKLAPNLPAQFNIDFNTHTVDLSFDPAKVAFLSDEDGKDYRQPIWEGAPAGGHHRSGTLTFTQPLGAQVKSATLTFTDIAGVPKRTFNWKVQF